MFEPFVPLTVIILEQLEKLKHVFLVCQTYGDSGSAAEQGTTSLLFSAYDDPGLAKIHFKAIRNDRFAVILNLTIDRHRNKMEKLISPGSGYKCFFAAVQSVKKVEAAVCRNYIQKIYQHVEKETNWSLNGHKNLKLKLQLIFGELHVVLSVPGRKLKLKLSDIAAT